ncbi:MAG: hypothetical protein FWD68_19210 [Alphaproteobacteria bacterium]|nr:hypothetical protein [Alphaproteobacteria bacterium]
MTYISPAARDQFSAPRHIFYSPVRILYFAVLLLALGALFFYFAYSEYSPPHLSQAFWFAASAVAIVGTAGCFLILPALLGLGRPALTISREGLKFRGGERIPWESISENVWQEQRAGIFSPVANRMIRLRVNGRRVVRRAQFLKCRGEDYLHSCAEYSGAAAVSSGPSSATLAVLPQTGRRDVSVRRQFPLRSTLWGLLFTVLSLAAGAIEVFTFADWRSAHYYVNYSNPSSTVLTLIFVAVFFVGFVVGIFRYLRPLVAFLFDPRPFVLGTDGVRLGPKSVAYRDIVRLRQDTSNAVTTVEGRNGMRLCLRWLIWADTEDWNRELEVRSLPAMLESFRARIAAGERLDFGKVLALDKNALYVRSRAIAFSAITSLHYQDSRDESVDVRELQIGTTNGAYRIEDRRIENPHVLLALTTALIEGGGGR